MNSKALALLQQTAVRASGSEDLTTHRPTILIPEGQKLTDVEHLYANRSRFRGRFTTNSIDDFAAYAKANTGGAGFINSDSMAATLFLNLGTTESPGHGDWTGELQLKRTAAYAALSAICDQRKTQREVAEFIDDWASIFAGAKLPDGAAQARQQTVTAIRNIVIDASKSQTSDVQQLSAQRTSLESVAAKSAASTLPESLSFFLTPFEGLKQREFVLRLSVIAEDGKAPALVLRIAQREKIIEEMAQEFAGLLRSLVGDSATMLVGNFKP